LLVGVIRERRQGEDREVAGTRTHALVAVLGFVGWGLGAGAFVATLVAVGALAVTGYLKTAQRDKGLTGEVALLLSLVLGGLTQTDAPLAAGLGVVCAILLYAKRPLHRLSRELISERELQDGLMLAAAALVVMPLLPQGALDPWGVLDPKTLWRIVVLVMAVGMAGHVALRAVGARWGLPIAGFFSGFASSSAAVAGLGRWARDESALTASAVVAALLANLASLLLFAAVIGAASPPLLRVMAWPLLAGVAGLSLVVGLCLHQTGVHDEASTPPPAGAFSMGHALALAGVIAGVSLVAAWLRHLYGDAGVLVAAILVALAEVHAAAATIAQVAATDGMATHTACWGLVSALGASVLAKTVLAFVSGGARYGRWVGVGLVSMLAATVAVTGLLGR
jgi:uncharacterized membrane protein (DUF4010 family)